jgi:hypothetical protein
VLRASSAVTGKRSGSRAVGPTHAQLVESSPSAGEASSRAASVAGFLCAQGAHLAGPAQKQGRWRWQTSSCKRAGVTPATPPASSPPARHAVVPGWCSMHHAGPPGWRRGCQHRGFLWTCAGAHSRLYSHRPDRVPCGRSAHCKGRHSGNLGCGITCPTVALRRRYRSFHSRYCSRSCVAGRQRGHSPRVDHRRKTLVCCSTVACAAQSCSRCRVTSPVTRSWLRPSSAGGEARVDGAACSHSPRASSAFHHIIRCAA